MSQKKSPEEVAQLAADFLKMIGGEHELDAATFLAARGKEIAEILVEAATPPVTFPLVEEFGRLVPVPGGDLDRLELREPTVSDLLKHGVLDGSVDGERMVSLVADLSGRPAPVIKAVPGKAFLRFTGQLTRFFAEAGR